MIAKAEFELQLTDLYSPREEPADAFTLGAAGSTGGVVSVAWGVGGVVGSSTAKAALKEEIAMIAILVRARDLIGEKKRK